MPVVHFKSIIAGPASEADVHDPRDHVITLTVGQSLRLLKTWLFVAGVWIACVGAGIGLSRLFGGPVKLTNPWLAIYAAAAAPVAIFTGAKLSAAFTEPYENMLSQAFQDRGVSPNEVALFCISARKWADFSKGLPAEHGD